MPEYARCLASNEIVLISRLHWKISLQTVEYGPLYAKSDVQLRCNRFRWPKITVRVRPYTVTARSQDFAMSCSEAKPTYFAFTVLNNRAKNQMGPALRENLHIIMIYPV